MTYFMMENFNEKGEAFEFNDTIPDKFPLGMDDSLRRWMDFPPIGDYISSFSLREGWMKKGMYAFVSWEWVIPFARWIGNKKCLEVMAGAGWLAKALREKEINIIATDDYSWSSKWGHKVLTDITEMNALTAIKQFGHECDILIISWPWMDSSAYKAIKKMNEVNPKSLIVYIGEGEGGCTANESFFNHFQEIDDGEFNKAAQKYKSWYGLHDQLLLGKYVD